MAEDLQKNCFPTESTRVISRTVVSLKRQALRQGRWSIGMYVVASNLFIRVLGACFGLDPQCSQVIKHVECCRLSWGSSDGREIHSSYVPRLRARLQDRCSAEKPGTMMHVALSPVS